MARRQSRIRLNPNSRVCQSLVSKNKNSRRANKQASNRGGYFVPVGVRRVQLFRAELVKLGFKNYEEYLASRLWETIRDSAFARWGRHCKACGFSATQIHHANYASDTLSGDSTDALWPVCRDCHTKAHDRAGGLEAANQWIRNAWRKRKQRAPR